MECMRYEMHNLHGQWDFKQWNVWDSKYITYIDNAILSNGLYGIENI
jgi:hypothetical protein